MEELAREEETGAAASTPPTTQTTRHDPRHSHLRDLAQMSLPDGCARLGGDKNAAFTHPGNPKGPHMSTRIAVVGANGGTGREVTRQLLERGDQVLAVVRTAAKGHDLEELGAEIALLDLLTSTVEEFATAFDGADAVVFAAGMGEGGDFDTVDRQGVITTVDAANAAGVRRIVAVSALGASRAEVPPPLTGNPYWEVYYDAKRAADAAVRTSGLDYTILQPGVLTEGELTGSIRLAEGDLEFADLSRADLAATVLGCLDDPASIGHTWELVGGEDSVAEAIRTLAAEVP
jgi:uncharacterized protein YbjT (DUF2867 family)